MSPELLECAADPSSSGPQNAFNADWLIDPLSNLQMPLERLLLAWTPAGHPARARLVWLKSRRRR